MKIWTDREGKKLDAREFIARWKQGVEEITPLQQIKTSIVGFIFIFIGIVWGFYFTIKLKQYWLTTILGGSFIISSVTFLGTMQKYLLLTRLEKEVEDGKY